MEEKEMVGLDWPVGGLTTNELLVEQHTVDGLSISHISFEIQIYS